MSAIIWAQKLVHAADALQPGAGADAVHHASGLLDEVANDLVIPLREHGSHTTLTDVGERLGAAAAALRAAPAGSGTIAVALQDARDGLRILLDEACGLRGLSR